MHTTKSKYLGKQPATMRQRRRDRRRGGERRKDKDSLSAAWGRQLGLRRGQGTLGPGLLLWLEAQRAGARKGTAGGSCRLQKSPPAGSGVTGV